MRISGKSPEKKRYFHTWLHIGGRDVPYSSVLFLLSILGLSLIIVVTLTMTASAVTPYYNTSYASAPAMNPLHPSPGAVTGRLTTSNTSAGLPNAYIAIVNAANTSQAFYQGSSDDNGYYQFPIVNNTWGYTVNFNPVNGASTLGYNAGYGAIYKIYANHSLFGEGFSNAFPVEERSTAPANVVIIPQPAKIIVTAEGVNISADASDNVKIVAYATDALGDPVADGTLVYFEVKASPTMADWKNAANGSLSNSGNWEGKQYVSNTTYGGWSTVYFGWVNKTYAGNNSTIRAYYPAGPLINGTTGIYFTPTLAIGSIQAAIDKANAGDTILIDSGTYTENIVINKQITLKGVNTGTGLPIINGNGNTAINIRTSGVTVQGFSITGATNTGQAGIHVNPGANDSIIKDINASGNYYGIYIDGANNNTITGNTANNNNNGNGIYLYASSNNILTGNTANNNAMGILLHISSNYNNLTGNTANNNTYGILLDSSSNNSLTTNTANNNTYSTYLVYNSSYNNLTTNTANNNTFGILLGSSSNYNILTGNTANNNDNGIYLYDSSNYNNLTGNTANNNDWDIYFDSSSKYNILTGNTVNNNDNVISSWITSGSGQGMCRDLRATDDGGYILAGYTYSPDNDAYLLKFDAYGNEQWNRSYGGDNYDIANAVQQTSDGGYILAGRSMSYNMRRTGYLVKTDAVGNELWNRSLGGQDEARFVLQTGDGGYVLTGNHNYQYEPDHYRNVMYLMKTDASGNVLWYNNLTTEGSAGYEIVPTSDGGFIVAGYIVLNSTNSAMYLVKTDNSGRVLWNRSYDITPIWDSYGSFKQTSDGGFIILSGACVTSADSTINLIRTDASGNMLWNKTYSFAGYDCPNSIIQTPDGEFLAVYTSSPPYGTVGIMKLNASGVLLWNKTLDSIWSEACAAVQSPNGGFVIAGDRWVNGNMYPFLANVPDLVEPFPGHNTLPMQRYSGKNVLVLVDNATYDQLQSRLARYAQDVNESIGANVIIINGTWNTPGQVYNTIRGQYVSGDLLGALLVGNIPFDYSKGCLSDFYYEDMNNDGTRDIWTGRLYPSKGGQGGISQLQNYFDKNHRYRTGELSYSDVLYYNSILINQDNGDESAYINTYDSAAQYLGFTNDSTTVFYDSSLSGQKAKWLSEIQKHYRFGFITVHGTETSEWLGESTYIDSTEIASASPNVLFMQLGSCSNGDYSTPGYLAGEFLFNGDCLVVEANTDVAMMVGNSDMSYLMDYTPLSLGLTVGEVYQMSRNGAINNLLGDPTIQLANSTEVGSVYSRGPRLSPTSSSVDFGEVSNSTNVMLPIVLTNEGNSTLVMQFLNTNTFGGPWGLFVYYDPANGACCNQIVIPRGESKTIYAYAVPKNQQIMESLQAFEQITLITNDPVTPYYNINCSAIITTPTPVQIPVPTPTPTQEISYDLNFVQGWNIVSIPIVPEDDRISSIFSPAEQANIDVIWDFNNGNWEYWTTEQGYTNQFDTISPQRGYNVYCYEPMTVHITGTPSSGPIPIDQLASGWNMIGFPSTTNANIADLYGSVDVVWKMEGNAWYYWTTEQGYTNQFDTLSPGLGYWVYKY